MKAIVIATLILFFQTILSQQIAFWGAGKGGNGIINNHNKDAARPLLNSRSPLPDSHQNEMQDKWVKHNNPNPPKDDNNANTLNKNFTNIEVYINSIINFKKLK